MRAGGNPRLTRAECSHASNDPGPCPLGGRAPGCRSGLSLFYKPCYSAYRNRRERIKMEPGMMTFLAAARQQEIKDAVHGSRYGRPARRRGRGRIGRSDQTDPTRLG